MQRSPLRDFIVGIFVLVGLASIGYLSIQMGGLYYSGPSGFKLIATFDEVGDLKPRAAVVIAGVKVGQVVSIELDSILRARCELDIDPSLGLDVETSASIMTAGLLGEKFVALEPGGSDEMLESGEEIDRTVSALSIENLVGKFVNDTGLEE
ncbi:MAG: outer membrane lipid asymmetry maintenance protein MlaD [Deltaproteobacteria bacterium]|nr:outer membrane lipid asymmetry maintenance protein MlaD [Deltaproteobacteria bacterium]